MLQTTSVTSTTSTTSTTSGSTGNRPFQLDLTTQPAGGELGKRSGRIAHQKTDAPPALGHQTRLVLKAGRQSGDRLPRRIDQLHLRTDSPGDNGTQKRIMGTA